MAASTTSSPKVWLITGCSSGFGFALALHVLNAGHKVIATSRVCYFISIHLSPLLSNFYPFAIPQTSNYNPSPTTLLPSPTSTLITPFTDKQESHTLSNQPLPKTEPQQNPLPDQPSRESRRHMAHP